MFRYSFWLVYSLILSTSFIFFIFEKSLLAFFFIYSISSVVGVETRRHSNTFHQNKKLTFFQGVKKLSNAIHPDCICVSGSFFFFYYLLLLPKIQTLYTVWSEGFLYKVALPELKISPIMKFFIHNSVVTPALWIGTSKKVKFCGQKNLTVWGLIWRFSEELRKKIDKENFFCLGENLKSDHTSQAPCY